jgi:hypothetical protein
VIASSAFFVLDAILDWPVTLYDGSWSQWGQMAAVEYSTPSGTVKAALNSDSPWRTDVPSRSEVISYNYPDTSAGIVVYTSASTTVLGLNDLTTSGTFTGTAGRFFRIQIDSVGATDTFRWTKNYTSQTIVWDASNVAITGIAQPLTEGLSVTFAAATGHTLNDRWEFNTRQAVELLALDGSLCSSSLSLNGTVTFNPSGCIPLPPNSYAGTANEIEEADSAYFGAGGGSGGGGGGGGPIAPGY